MAKQIILLERLGFSGQSQAANISAATKVFGQSAEEAAQLNRDFLGLGQVFGMTGDDISASFQSAVKSLGQFGKNVLTSFPKLQSVAKKTGMAMDSMFGIINKFNTFEDAAGMVGQLNAVLGGPFLDSIELLKKEDPAEIIEEISGAFDAAGMDFQKSGRHMKHAISSILGVSADEAARLLSEGGDAFGAAQITVEDAARMTAQSTSDLISQSRASISKTDTLLGEVKKVMETINQSFGPDGAAMAIQNGLNELVNTLRDKVVPEITKFITEIGLLIEKLKDADVEKATAGAFDMGIAGTIAGGSIGAALLTVAGALGLGLTAPVSLGLAAGGAALGGLALAGNQVYENIQGRASGGNVNSGHPYLVGERGQELFVPSQPGMIQSNDSYLTKEDFMEGINALIAATTSNTNIVMDSEIVGRLVQKNVNKRVGRGISNG